MELKLTQKEISEIFAYLNKQPYEFSQPLFKWFYEKLKEQSTNEVGVHDKEDSEKPKAVGKRQKV